MNLYTPILVLGAIAAVFAVGRWGIAVLIGPRRYNHSKLEAYECGIEPMDASDPRRGGDGTAIPGQVLPHGDDVHRVRHRDRLPVSVGGRVRQSRRLRGSSRWPCSCSTSRWRTHTNGGGEAWYGTRGAVAGRHSAVHGREGRGLRTQGFAVAGDIRAGVLRHRDDGHRRAAFRHLPFRHGALFGHAAAGRPDDRRGTGQPEDGAGASPDL